MFEPISIEWSGQSYVVPPDRVMKAIACVERVVTIAELGEYAKRGTAPTVLPAMAYGALLRFAGAKVTDEEVMVGMYGKSVASPSSVLEALWALLILTMPPGAEAKEPTGDAARGNASPAVQKASSKRPTSSRSAPGK